jgi:hypothetical protein
MGEMMIRLLCLLALCAANLLMSVNSGACEETRGLATTASPEQKGFAINPLTADDKEQIRNIFKPLESKWVPSEELAQYPELYWSEDWQKQSFRITSTQPGLEDVYFVPIAADFKEGTNASKRWSQSVSLLIINRNDSKIHLLPTHPVMAWDAAEIGLVAFRDVRGDGRRSIIVDVKGNTGAGPEAAVPFDVFAIYLPTGDGGWVLDAGLQKHLEQCRSLGQALKIAKSYFTAKK